MKPIPTTPVRITTQRYRALRKDAKANGHTISWLLNYIIDLYYQDRAIAQAAPDAPKVES